MGMNNYKYFMFSREHYNKNKTIYEKIDKEYIAKTVLVRGEWRQYTDIVSSPADCHYTDSIIVTSGELRTIKYTK